jgi:site-specific DNA recombinase
VTASNVRWMFAERLAGRSVAGIARELNERGVPCPSRVDPGRNRHRTGQGWNLRSVAVILANPRYTGREVWHRHQRVDSDGGRQRSPGGWAVSRSLAHPALVSEAHFVAIQQVRAARRNDEGTVRRYVLAGLIRCGLCGRRMDAHWVNGRAGYRCRHGHSSARPLSADRPKNLYVREDTLLTWLRQQVTVEGALRAPSGSEVAAWLRSQARVVVRDRTGWSLMADDDH